ncbi:MAG: hypothetical protein IJ589_05450 [Lachnospiraceae bacterium]|nr:hypothetical protein [Lachnospiraceae bacterium]
MRRKITPFFALVLAGCLLSACGNKPEPVPEPEPEPVIDEYAPVSIQAATSAQVVKTISLEINPSFTMGLDSENKVIELTAENMDAFVVLDALGNYFPESTDGVELKYVMRDVALATARSDLDIQDYSMNVHVDGDVPETVVQEACREAAAEVYEDQNIEVSCRCTDMNIDFVCNQDTIDSIRDLPCTLCGGTGSCSCSHCGGTGVIITTRTHQEEVRNDYVCPVCGGKGWVDDGMHGGQTAVCGNCGGGSQPASADFRELAYDIVDVTEEFEDPCPACGGTGSTPCTGCNGTGILVAP